MGQMSSAECCVMLDPLLSWLGVCAVGYFFNAQHSSIWIDMDTMQVLKLRYNPMYRILVVAHCRGEETTVGFLSYY